jgi:hypothetical protein
MAAGYHLGFCRTVKFDQICAYYVTGPNWRSNFVKIGQRVRKLQHFLQIQDGGRRDLEFWHKFKFDQAGV